jgi:hypothetical protein
MQEFALVLARNIWVGWDFVFPVLGSPLSGFSSFGCVILFVRSEFLFLARGYEHMDMELNCATANLFIEYALSGSSPNLQKT